MNRAVIPMLGLALGLVLACDKSSTTQPCDATTNGASTNSTSSSGSTALDAAIRDAARNAAKVERMKIRVDDSGKIVKQSVYHGDASTIPAAVRELAEATFPGGRPQFYETELYADIGQVFEVEVETADGKHCEVSGQPDGTLVYTECQLDPRELPDHVTKRIEETIPGGKIIEAEQKTGPDVDEYSVEIEHEGREFYLRIGPDGELHSKHLRVPAIVEIPIP